jgi:hypothetical protein
MKQSELQQLISTMESNLFRHAQHSPKEGYELFSRIWYYPKANKDVIVSLLTRRELFNKLIKNSILKDLKIQLNYQLNDEEVFFELFTPSNFNLEQLAILESEFLTPLTGVLTEIVNHTILPLEQLLLKSEVYPEDIFNVFDFLNKDSTEETIVYLDWLLPYINQLEEKGLIFDFSQNLEHPVIALDLDDRIKFISKKEYDLIKLKERVVPELKERVNITEGQLWIERNFANYLKDISMYNHAEVEHICDYLNSLVSDNNPNLTREQKEEELLKERTRSSLFKMSYEDLNQKSEQWLKTMVRKASFAEDGDGIVKVWESGEYHFVKIQSKNSLSRESNFMNHCVRGYDIDRIKSGEASIYSLRDDNNEPHCTIEVVKGSVKQVKGNSNKETKEIYHKAICDFLSNYLQVSFDQVSPYDLDKFGYERVVIEGENYYFQTKEAQEIKELLPFKNPLLWDVIAYKKYLEELKDKVKGKFDVENIINKLTNNLSVCPLRHVYDTSYEIEVVNKLIELQQSNSELFSYFNINTINSLLDERKNTTKKMKQSIISSINSLFKSLGEKIQQAKNEELDNLYHLMHSINMFFNILDKVDFESLFVLNALNFKDKDSFEQLSEQLISEELHKVMNFSSIWNKTHDEFGIFLIKLQELKNIKKIEEIKECNSCEIYEKYQEQLDFIENYSEIREDLVSAAGSVASANDILADVLGEIDTIYFLYKNKIKKTLVSLFDYKGQIKNDFKSKNKKENVLLLIGQVNFKEIFGSNDSLIDLYEEFDEEFSLSDLEIEINSFNKIKAKYDNSLRNNIQCKACVQESVLYSNDSLILEKVSIEKFDLELIKQFKNELDNYIESLKDMNVSIFENIVDKMLKINS